MLRLFLSIYKTKAWNNKSFTIFLIKLRFDFKLFLFALRSYQLSAWDFAGQEDFYATHPCFISERAMYIALYDASLGVNQLQTLKPWLTAIHARADNCPVFIVGSHADKLRK